MSLRKNELGLADLAVNSSLKIADALFDSHDYPAAELGYPKAFSLAQDLASNPRNELELGDLAEVSMKTAMCCFH
jgi:hypothetical protein